MAFTIRPLALRELMEALRPPAVNRTGTGSRIAAATKSIVPKCGKYGIGPRISLSFVHVFVNTIHSGRQKAKLNLLDSGLVAWLRCSPVPLLVTPPASLLSTHRDLWRSRI